jgi:ribonucleoside-diphosphate reductase alpha chain
MSSGTPFGPAGSVVYNRTYSRTRNDGTKETWPETVRRVVFGNLSLVYKDSDSWTQEVWEEAADLCEYMNNFALLPAGRHLWSTGVPGRQYLQNCFTSGWGEKLSDHFAFTFLRLMEGGGVGSNYSSSYINQYGHPRNKVNCHIVANENHKDYEELKPYLSDRSPSEIIVEDSREGWADALTDLIESAYTGFVNRAYNVSRVRPSGSPLKTFGGTASGPAPFARMMHEVARVLNDAYDNGFTPLHAMEIDHAIAECVVSGGNRRSARMSVLHWNDKHITKFLKCKNDTGKHWTTNISVEIDDEFLESLNGNRGMGAQVQANWVHEVVCKGMLENGEPGYWNSSLSSAGEIGQSFSPNPCGEQILEQWESCNLGHVNMDYFAGKDDELEEAHRLMTRFLIRATFSDMNDPRQIEIVGRNRRIGVGHLGVQGYWAKQGIKYSDIPRLAPSELRRLYQTVRDEARRYAFALRIPEPVKVTTVAPTGSVAKLPGVSEGIHPIYARWFERRIRFSKRDASQVNTVLEAMEQGFRVENDVYDQSGMTAVVVYPTEDILVQQVRDLGHDESVVQSAEELTIDQMLEVQKCYQENWADNAVSYTVNVPENIISAPVLADILADYLPHLKGTTIMVDSSRPQAPYTRITKEAYERALAKTAEDSTNLECRSGACPIK